jgi:hypothetical protein
VSSTPECLVPSSATAGEIVGWLRQQSLVAATRLSPEDISNQVLTWSNSFQLPGLEFELFKDLVASLLQPAELRASWQDVRRHPYVALALHRRALGGRTVTEAWVGGWKGIPALSIMTAASTA